MDRYYYRLVVTMVVASLGTWPLSQSSAREFAPHCAFNSVDRDPRCQCSDRTEAVECIRNATVLISEEMIRWIANRMEWQVPSPPSVVLRPRAEFIQLWSRAAYGRIGDNQSLGDGEEAEVENLRGFYIHATRTIVFPDVWHPFSLRNQSILLHELVHHLQLHNRVNAQCAAALERQAYHLQIEWLRQNGVDQPYELLGTDEFTIRIRSMCPTSDE